MKYRIHAIEWELQCAERGHGHTGPALTIWLDRGDETLPRLLALDHRAHAMVGKNLEQQAVFDPAVDHMYRLDAAACGV